jgi:hypothetical protein
MEGGYGGRFLPNRWTQQPVGWSVGQSFGSGTLALPHRVTSSVRALTDGDIVDIRMCSVNKNHPPSSSVWSLRWGMMKLR